MNPTNEHREQAREIAKRYTVEGTGYADRLYQLAYAIEQALSSRDAEVREVLEGAEVQEIRARAYNAIQFSADVYMHDVRRLLQLIGTAIADMEGGDADDETVSR